MMAYNSMLDLAVYLHTYIVCTCRLLTVYIVLYKSVKKVLKYYIDLRLHRQFLTIPLTGTYALFVKWNNISTHICMTM